MDSEIKQSFNPKSMEMLHPVLCQVRKKQGRDKSIYGANQGKIRTANVTRIAHKLWLGNGPKGHISNHNLTRHVVVTITDILYS